jgi:heme exporter protein CcmD
MDITHYFDMGKYGSYVWSSYALSAIVLLGNLLVAVRGHRKEYRCAWSTAAHLKVEYLSRSLRSIEQSAIETSRSG